MLLSQAVCCVTMYGLKSDESLQRTKPCYPKRMDIDEVFEYLSWALDMEIPPRERQVLTTELVQLLLRENRIWAEKQGIGKESELSPKPSGLIPFQIDVEKVNPETAPALHRMLIRGIEQKPKNQQERKDDSQQPSAGE